ncbi:hypothetical protein GCM10022239_20610 [Leifsonia bigeumensis]|uniref:Glycosyltransferase RgtA/B/C/D-like domain-containing protein n=2 Tax=Leifsonella bigeumensis TaxID=433643 RepID=A0ABP7FQJ7_9MICO
MSAERPLSSLFAMLHTVDAVHGAYYFLLHFWIDLFGASELSVRLPSALAVGFVTAGTVVLAQWLFSRRVAAFSGIVCVLLPRFTYMGEEARSYALSTAVAVWLTVLLVRLLVVHTRRTAAWAAYAVGLALGIYLFLYLALLVVVHGILILSSGRSRRLLRRWSTTALLGLLAAAPVIAFGIAQRHQIAFLAHRHRVTVLQVVFDQWFGDLWLGLLCWAFVVLAVVLGLRPGRRSQPNGMVLLVAWLLVPTSLLLLGNAVVAPMYTNRYLSFCTPAAAILVAAGVAALPRNWMRIVSIGVLVTLALPVYLSQRTEFGMPGGSDWAKASELIGQDAKPGDGILFDQHVKPSWRPRLAMHLYPEDYLGLNDLALLTPYDETTGLWDRVIPQARIGTRLGSVSTVWALETTRSKEDAANSDIHVLERNGFSVIHKVRIHRTIVYELTRSTP